MASCLRPKPVFWFQVQQRSSSYRLRSIQPDFCPSYFSSCFSPFGLGRQAGRQGRGRGDFLEDGLDLDVGARAVLGRVGRPVDQCRDVNALGVDDGRADCEGVLCVRRAELEIVLGLGECKVLLAVASKNIFQFRL